MSIRDLFEKNYVSKTLSSDSLDDLGKNAESADNVVVNRKKVKEFIPPLDYATASNFAVYGSAEKYYEDAVKRIYLEYPYDGSKKEKNEFSLSSSYLDKFVFDKRYPRTTGYIILASKSSAISDSLTYPTPVHEEYIETKGGPNTDRTTDQSLASSYTGSNPAVNVFDLAKDRGSNLRFHPLSGSTVEFWMNKSQFPNSGKREVVFDLWNQTVSTLAGYGRLRIDMDPSSGFRVTYRSGSAGGFADQQIGTSATLTKLTDGKWHHYAFTFLSSSSDFAAKLYVDGDLDDLKNAAAAVAMNEVTGALNSFIGALQTTPVAPAVASAGAGNGKLAASLDEFRYWKVARTAEEVGRNWFTQVYGGTNTDDANTDLGVYYKFNEGITGNSTLDSVVLDFSGRVSNGAWTGYSATARNTGSAMVSASAAPTEFADPIIYSVHPDVSAVLDGLKLSGSNYDYTNNASIYNSLPAWIVEEDTTGDLKNLVQIIGSYFDKLQSQIKAVPQLKNIQYLSSSFKEYPFATNLVESAGMISSDVFVDSNVLEEIMSRDEDRNYELQFEEIKNSIYQNIYNNLVYIYKAKGTEKAFRNLVHCYGVGEDLVRLNTYGNNVTYDFKQNVRSSVSSKNLVNLLPRDNRGGTIFQMTSSTPADPDQSSFISGSGGDNTLAASGKEDFIGLTLEAEVVFPSYVEVCATTASVPTTLTSASLFGMHSAIASTPAETTWGGHGAADYADIRVLALRDEVNSPDARFMVTSSQTNIPTITTDLYRNVYDDNKWNFAVRVVPKKHPIGNAVSGSLVTAGYDLEFYGISKELDVVKEEFSLSDSIKATIAGQRILRSPKRVFAGAHRTNFTGSLLQPSDVKLSAVRFWNDVLPNTVISAHANDSEVYGALNPFRNAFGTQTTLAGEYIPEFKTLALNWSFYNVTGSNTLGQFPVLDLSSGSVDTKNKYLWLGNIVNVKHSGKGFGFPASDDDVLDRTYIPQARQALPEIVQSSDMVNILSDDDINFTRQTRPINYFFSPEKSMYQVISDEIIKAFATIVEFNNLIGDPVNRYRQDYKLMEKARNLFFAQVENDPNLDKFLEFYKWIDASLSIFLLQLIPASAASSETLRNLVESHVLERNKYWTKFPTLERKGPVSIEGTSDSSVASSFEMTAPNLYVQTKHEQYWKEKAARDESPLATGVTVVDTDRQKIFNTIQTTLGSKRLRPYKLSVQANSEDKPPRSPRRTLKGGINYPTAKERSLILNATQPFGPRAASGTPLNTALINDTDVIRFTDVTGSGPRELLKRYYPFKISFRREDETGIKSTNTGSYVSSMKGTIGAPFNLVSSSVTTGYNRDVQRKFMSGSAVVNLHSDTFITNEIPIQGPFTNAHVGGHQSRHVPVNRYNSSFTSTNKVDDYLNRPEAWRIELGTRFDPTDPKIMGFVGPDYPFPVGPYPYTQFRWAIRYRNVGAKRPLNIRNVSYTTASTTIGNYQNNYEVVQTMGRTINNRYFTQNEGIQLPTTLSIRANLPATNTLSNLLGLKHGATSDGNFFGVKIDGGVADVSNRYEVLAQFLRPNRSGSAKTKSIFANRFSAPGGPDVQSIGYLDLAAAEKSVYNALPFRNLSILSSGSGETGTIRVQDQLNKRRGLRTLRTLHAGQFGYDATFGSVPELDYITLPSYFKTNRNSIKRNEFKDDTNYTDNDFIVAKTHDNQGITHPIPRSDLQYSWVTASYTVSRIYGHAWNDSIVSSSTYGYEQAIQYTTQSYVFAGDIPVDFANLNTLVLDPIDIKNNIVSGAEAPNYSGYKNTSFGTIANVEMLNSILLHRGGPYGVNTWTQLRAGNRALARKLRESNIISFVKKATYDYPVDVVSSSATPSYSAVTQYTENPVVSKFAPLIQSVQVNRVTPDGRTVGSKANLETSYANSLSAFNNIQLNNQYNVREDYTEAYDKIKDLYLDDASDDPSSPVNELNRVVYSETVYPSALNAYSSSVRGRPDYVSSFWRNNRADRTKTNVSSFGNTVPKQSMWSLDADSDFLTRRPDKRMDSTGGAGLLQNNYFQLHSGTVANIKPGAVFGRRNTISNAHSVVGPEGILIVETGSMTRATTTYTRLSASQMFGGQALWEVAAQAGKEPWYNSYADYVADMRLKGKDYSIVPEFRISDHVSYYLKDKSNNFLANNPDFLVMTGGLSYRDKSGEESFYRTYTNSDFLKFFATVREDHVDVASPTSIKLSCKGLLKFLPYDGFYPSERTVQIAETFSSSYGRFINYETGGGATSKQGWRTFSQPMFGPGVMFNSIKAGIAVDFPVMTSSVDFHTITNDGGTGTRYISGSNSTGRFGTRIPFEALVEPENYLTDIDICDMEPHLSGVLNVTASWDGYGSPIYKLMASNFLAESIHLFLPEGKPTTLVSRPESAWDSVEKDKVYAARVKIRKSYNAPTTRTGSLGFRNPLTPVDQWRGSLRSTFTMCSAPFMYGPPVGAGTTATLRFGSPDGFNPCFTPPYEYGEAWADIFFTAPAAGSFTIDDLLSPTNLAVSYLRIGSDWGVSQAAGKGVDTSINTILNVNNVEFNSMQLDSSLNLFGKAQIKKVTYDPNTGEPIQVEDDANDNAWTIQTKFETPMLNMANAAVTNPTNGSGSVPRCVWMQYGQPSADPSKGVFLSVSDIPPNYISGALNGDPALTGSLVDLVGLGTKEQRLGEVADSKTIREAIVAVPYFQKGSERRFFELPRAEIDKALLKNPGVSGSVQSMVDAMQRYVLPPQFDFIVNPDAVTPFAMYLFEFEHTLNRDDLVDMWQGLPPRIGRAFDPTNSEFEEGNGSPTSEIVKEVEISHPLILGELLNGDNFPSDLRWMVFKVKQKANTNYFDMVIRDQLNADNTFNKGKAGKIGRSGSEKQETPKYSFNWPYDFFSLVELVKIDAEVELSAKDE